jgi:hypothetical protein
MNNYSLERVNLHCKTKKSLNDNPLQEGNRYLNYNLKTETDRKLFVPMYFHNLPDEKNICSDSVYNNIMMSKLNNIATNQQLFNNDSSFNRFPVNSRLHNNMEMDINAFQTNKPHNIKSHSNPILNNINQSTRCRKDNISTSNMVTRNRYTGINPNNL